VANIYDQDAQSSIVKSVITNRIDDDAASNNKYNMIVEELDDLSNLSGEGPKEAGAADEEQEPINDVHTVDVTFESPNRQLKDTKTNKLAEYAADNAREKEQQLNQELASLGPPRKTNVEDETLIEFAYYVKIVEL
jgi:hypothetical protein